MSSHPIADTGTASIKQITPNTSRSRAAFGNKKPAPRCDRARSTVGDRRGLADRMSGAWVAFARTGNPNHALLPKWEPFAPAARQTMMLGHDCRLQDDPYREERVAIGQALQDRAVR